LYFVQLLEHLRERKREEAAKFEDAEDPAMLS
jgi:hypothetical protein